MKKQDKSKEIFGLMKVPDHIIIKQLLIEKGKSETYIQELEHTITEMQAKLSQYEKQ